MLFRGCLVVALIFTLFSALGGMLLLEVGASLLTRQNITLDVPLCDASLVKQACPAPNEVAAKVVALAEQIANHLYVASYCGADRSFPNCFYTWPDQDFPQAVTDYAHRLCDGLLDPAAKADCSTAWAINSSYSNVVAGRFQCVSLVRGAYSQVYPMNLPNDAFQLWNTYRNVKGWKEIAADPRAAAEKPRGMPLPGDAVIIWRNSDADAGHTAIITSVGAPNAQGDRVVKFAQANSNVRYDQFILHSNLTATLNWPGNVKVFGYLRPDLPVSNPGASGAYSIVGKPTISADLINNVLSKAGSPAAGTGQAMYDLGAKYGIDPVFALAFFQHESSFGLNGVATVTHSLGNMRCVSGYACYCQGSNDGCYAAFDTWQQGFEAWYKLMRDQYVDAWHLDTVDAIIPKYAPSADHNNEAAYIASIKTSVDSWRAGHV